MHSPVETGGLIHSRNMEPLGGSRVNDLRVFLFAESADGAFRLAGGAPQRGVRDGRGGRRVHVAHHGHRRGGVLARPHGREPERSQRRSNAGSRRCEGHVLRLYRVMHMWELVAWPSWWGIGVGLGLVMFDHNDVKFFGVAYPKPFNRSFIAGGPSLEPQHG